ncbi:MAG TPA: nucleoside deaminase [Bacteroidia bacterium]|nr:nucleoside deaminase [Bacteroidia bacterium]
MEILFDDKYFMQQALVEAGKALDADEVPIGAVIVAGGKVIARAHNLVERLNDVTAHAEMMAFTAAADNLGGKYLKDCTLYVTLEPCVMCAGAAFWTQIPRVVIGATDEKRGFINAGVKLHPTAEIVTGVLEEECSKMIIGYFKSKR